MSSFALVFVHGEFCFCPDFVLTERERERERTTLLRVGGKAPNARCCGPRNESLSGNSEQFVSLRPESRRTSSGNDHVLTNIFEVNTFLPPFTVLAVCFSKSLWIKRNSCSIWFRRDLFSLNMDQSISFKLKRQKKNEMKEKVAFLVKWLVVMFSVFDILLHLVFVFVDKEIRADYPQHFDIRYYYWYLALAILSLIILIYSSHREDYLWLWSSGTMIFIVLFLGITGEASLLLLGPYSAIMILAFVYGKIVRYRPRTIHVTEIAI